MRNLCTVMRNLRSAKKSGPWWPQLEKACAQQRRPNTAIKKERKEGRQEGRKERKKEKEKKGVTLKVVNTLKIMNTDLRNG